MESTRKCPVCDGKILGRVDKRFCSDHCRAEFNNQINKDSGNLMRRINNILRRNRRILSELNPKGKAKIPSYKLAERGFNFKYYTSTCISRRGNTYYYCYEQGYHSLNRDSYALIAQNKKMSS